MNKVQEAYKEMNANRNVAKKKGDLGETILIELAKTFQDITPCTILHSYSYPYASNRNKVMYPGNVKYENGKYVEYTKEGYSDECDLVIVTDYAIFLIECKARSGKWKFYNSWADHNNTPTDKCPVMQSEKHARHLYHTLYEYIPHGDPSFVVPMLMFVDKATITDSRTKARRGYIPIGIANNFKELLNKYNVPHGTSGISRRELVNHMLRVGTAKKVYN